MKTVIPFKIETTRSSAKRFKEQRELRVESFKIFDFAREKTPLGKIQTSRKKYKPKDYWNNEISILKEAIKYSGLRELSQNNQMCYNSANKNFPGLLRDFYGVREEGVVFVNTRKCIEICNQNILKN